MLCKYFTTDTHDADDVDKERNVRVCKAAPLYATCGLFRQPRAVRILTTLKSGTWRIGFCQLTPKIKGKHFVMIKDLLGSVIDVKQTNESKLWWVSLFGSHITAVTVVGGVRGRGNSCLDGLPCCILRREVGVGQCMSIHVS